MNPEVTSHVRERVRVTSGDRCGYCLSSQRYVLTKLEIEHIIPKSADGSDEESNLWLACGLSNRYKGSQVAAVDPETETLSKLFNPRTEHWSEHFRWTQSGTVIEGLSPTGRATVVALKLNNELAVEVRRNWILAGWHPPEP